MKRVARWIGMVLIGFAALGALGVGAVFAGSELVLRKTWPKQDDAIHAARDPGAVARGARIAEVYGCTNCHGADLTGTLFHDEPQVARMWAPNLTLVVARDSDAELERAIRKGVASDGRGLWIMPSEAFARFTDDEMADLLAYLRTTTPKGQVLPGIQMGPVGRVGAVMGKFRSAPQAIADDAGRAPPDFGARHQQGRQLARACMECHGLDLKGGGALNAPDLAIAAAYDSADFARLLRTGVAAGGRQVGLMSQVSPARFARLTDAEIAALQDYLKAHADVAPPT